MNTDLLEKMLREWDPTDRWIFRNKEIVKFNNIEDYYESVDLCDYHELNEKLDWGQTMEKMLERDYPQYMNSVHSKVPVVKPKMYEEKSGSKRKIFILNNNEE